MSDRSDVLRRRVLVGLGFLLFLLACVRGSLLDGPGLVDVFLSMGMGVIAVKFCIVDYRMRGSSLVRSYHWLIFFTWPFALPVYLLCSRGIGKGLVAIAAVLAGAFVASVAGYGIAWAIWSFGG